MDFFHDFLLVSAESIENNKSLIPLVLEDRRQRNGKMEYKTGHFRHGSIGDDRSDRASALYGISCGNGCGSNSSSSRDDRAMTTQLSAQLGL